MPSPRASGLHVMTVLQFGLLALMVTPTRATQYAPTHYLGSCLTEEWVTDMEQKLDISASQRDPTTGALVHPFLHAALKYPRYSVRACTSGLSSTHIEVNILWGVV